MSTYFFHLRLELYSTPAPNKRRKLAHSDPRSQVFVPPSGSDIFKTILPAHRSSKWASYTQISSLDRTRRQAPKSDGYASDSPPLRSPNRRLSREFIDTHGDAVLLPERSLNLKRKDISTPPRATSITKLSNDSAAKDWRYNSVEIESIDMEKSKSSTSSGLQTKAVYLPSDPKTTDVGWGIVHLYQDSEESAVPEEHSSSRRSLGSGKEDAFDSENCTTLCILAVPSWMMPSDLLGFVGDQAREDVSHFRLIRTGRANKYMVLMKFRSPRKAKDWQKANNGRLFSSAEPENCHVVFIKSVEFLSPDSNLASAANSFPHNTNDPFTSTDTNRTSQGFSSKPLAPPPRNLLELPTCPVCLERMDETTGLLTILCQHVFHCACLEKWRGSGCPVCRYTHSPSYTFPYPRPSTFDDADTDGHPTPLCSVCASPSNLWICLICGNLGCGRYDEAHAYAHYEATSHCYAMDTATQHVWDYAGDGYVHRLIQSKPPPTPEDNNNNGDHHPHHHHHHPPDVAASSPRPRHVNEAFRAEPGDSVPREKMESMAAEYTYLLTSQLEGQRRYFEEQVERAADKAAAASVAAEAASARAEQAQTELAVSREEREGLAAELGRVGAALERSERARGKFEAMARELSTSLREERSMAEGLMERVKRAGEREAEAKEQAERWRVERAELEEMNRDLSMFISGQEKVRELQAAGEEVVDGSVSVPARAGADEGSAGGAGGSGKRKGKGRKK